MEMRRQEIADAIRGVDEGRGVIMLTDLFGGTPSNLAISLLEAGRTEVIAGVNLPMLIRLESARKTMELRPAVIAAREAGQKYISVASELLGVGLCAICRRPSGSPIRAVFTRAPAPNSSHSSAACPKPSPLRLKRAATASPARRSWG